MKPQLRDAQMVDLMHAMRARITGTADYLWSVRRIVPFVKVDHGLADFTAGPRRSRRCRSPAVRS